MRESGRSLITPTLPFDKLFCFLPNHIRFYVCRSGYYKFRLSIFPTPLQRRPPPILSYPSRSYVLKFFSWVPQIFL